MVFNKWFLLNRVIKSNTAFGGDLADPFERYVLLVRM